MSSLAWAPDAKTLWVGADDGVVSGWAVGRNGAVSKAGVELDTGPAVVSALAVSPDGETLAAGTKRGELHVWRRSTGATWTEDDHSMPPLAGWVDSIAFSPDGISLAVGATGNDIRILDSSDTSERAAMVTPGPVTAVAYTGGGVLASGSSDGFARLWPVPGVVIGPVGDSVFDVAIPDPGRVVVGASQKVSALLSYDVSHRDDPIGCSAPPWSGSENRLAGIITVSPDGNLAAMGSAGGEVQLWDTTDFAHAQAVGAAFPAASDFVDAMAISADGTVLAVGSDASVVNLWDISDPARPRPLAQTEDAGGQVDSVAFQPGANVLAAATTGGNVRLWDIGDPTHPHQIADLTGPANDIGMVAFDPAGPRLAAATFGGIIWQWDLIDPEHPRLLAKLHAASGVIYALAWSPDGAAIAAGGSAQKVWTWTADAAKAVEELFAVAGESITESEWELYVQERDYDPPCASGRAPQ